MKDAYEVSPAKRARDICMGVHEILEMHERKGMDINR